MLNKNSQKVIKLVFLPALLLSVLLCCSSALLQFSQNALIGKQIGFSEIPALKVFTLPLQIILGISLLIFSIYKPFEKVFKGALLILTGVIVLLTGLMVFQEHLIPSGVSESFGMYKPLVTHWPVSLMYIGLSIFNFSLFSLFIWGFINRLVVLSEGIKYYIPLALLLGAAGAFTSNVGLMLIGASKWPLMALVIPAIVFMVSSLFVFDWSWKRLPNSLIQPQQPAGLQTRFPFLSAAYLLSGCAMIKEILDFLFKSQAKNQFRNPSDYQHFVGNYSMSVDSAIITISIIWAVFGTWLLLKKGWKTTSLYASISILLGGIIFLSFSFSWLGQGVFSGLLLGTASALFFPLIQILYLFLPYQSRFKTKIFTEMIALPFMKAIPSLTTTGLLVGFGSIGGITIYLKIFVAILLILLIVAAYRASLKTVETKTKL